MIFRCDGKLKQMRWEAFRPATLLKRDSNTVFPVKFVKFFKTCVLKNICDRLLLFCDQ